MLAIGTIAEIAVNRQNRFGHGLKMFRGQEADDVRDAREGLNVSVRHAHAAAGNEVVARELPVLLNDDESEVVGENINVVKGWERKSSFEFPRQVRFAVERIDEVGVFAEVQLFAFDPNRV